MADYSLTSLIHRARGRVYARRMASSPYHEIVVNHPLKPTFTISNLTYHEAQQRLNHERVLLALESLGLSPAKVSEYMKKLDEEHHQRTHKFDEDLKWLSENVNLNLVTTRSHHKRRAVT